jgi:hypothetical protein
MSLHIRPFLEKYFYFFMSLLIAAVVTYGFSHTVDQNLIHPTHPRPKILWPHAIIFTCWLVFYILQSALVRLRKVRIHKILGWFGLALGIIIIFLGPQTAFVLARYYLHVDHKPLTFVALHLSIPLFDILCFTCTFIPAILCRKKPELHRRLILLASCSLSAAGWGRTFLGPQFCWLGVDFFILLGIVRDLIVMRRVHKVYRWGLPTFFIGQATVYTLFTIDPPFFLRFYNFLLS